MNDNYGGAFGNYPEGSVGAVLNSLLDDYQLPMRIVDSVEIVSGEVFYAGKLYGTYEWAESKLIFNKV